MIGITAGIASMQAEVDKQDDMLDFSKTDAYRSNQRRSQEGQPGPPAGGCTAASPPASYSSGGTMYVFHQSDTSTVVLMLHKLHTIASNRMTCSRDAPDPHPSWLTCTCLWSVQRLGDKRMRPQQQ